MSKDFLSDELIDNALGGLKLDESAFVTLHATMNQWLVTLFVEADGILKELCSIQRVLILFHTAALICKKASSGKNGCKIDIAIFQVDKYFGHISISLVDVSS